MRCTRADAEVVLRGWARPRDKARIEAIFDARGFSGNLVGLLLLRADSEVAVTTVDADRTLRFRLDDVADFGYVDPREANDSDRGDVPVAVEI